MSNLYNFCDAYINAKGSPKQSQTLEKQQLQIIEIKK